MNRFKAILIGNSADRLGVDYDKSIENLDTFAELVGIIENSGRTRGRNPYSSASGLYQFVRGSIEPAVNRLKRHIGMLQWMEDVLITKDASTISREQQTLLFLADLLEKKGSDRWMKEIMNTGDREAMLQAYLQLHHTNPSDKATVARARKVMEV